MDEIIGKIQQAMNILAGICPRVDQVTTISIPAANAINLLADARDKLIKRVNETQNAEEQTNG